MFKDRVNNSLLDISQTTGQKPSGSALNQNPVMGVPPHPYFGDFYHGVCLVLSQIYLGTITLKPW